MLERQAALGVWSSVNPQPNTVHEEGASQRLVARGELAEFLLGMSVDRPPEATSGSVGGNRERRPFRLGRNLLQRLLKERQGARGLDAKILHQRIHQPRLELQTARNGRPFDCFTKVVFIQRLQDHAAVVVIGKPSQFLEFSEPAKKIRTTSREHEDLPLCLFSRMHKIAEERHPPVSCDNPLRLPNSQVGG